MSEDEGPRGGKTQTTPGGFRRKGFYLLPDEVNALRRASYERECSESEIVRLALREYLGLEDD